MCQLVGASAASAGAVTASAEVVVTSAGAIIACAEVVAALAGAVFGVFD